MRIAHLSDLHFGTETTEITESLTQGLQALKPELVIVSGDFTQRGTPSEFKKAQEFLKNLPAPFLAVPGNHDVPALNLWQRFASPYKNYRSFIDQNLEPSVHGSHSAIVSLNSSRRALPHWNWANGAVSQEQRNLLREFFEDVPPQKWRVCVLHHPIHKVEDMPLDVTVFGRKRTLALLHDLKVDLVLTGHVHHASFSTKGDENHQTAYVSASTALSSRTREQENGFNMITLTEQSMQIEFYHYKANRFERYQSHKIEKQA